MNIKYDNASDFRDFVLKKVQISEKPKKLKVYILNEYFVHHALSLLSVSLIRLKLLTLHLKINGTSIISSPSALRKNEELILMKVEVFI